MLRVGSKPAGAVVVAAADDPTESAASSSPNQARAPATRSLPLMVTEDPSTPLAGATEAMRGSGRRVRVLFAALANFTVIWTSARVAPPAAPVSRSP